MKAFNHVRSRNPIRAALVALALGGVSLVHAGPVQWNNHTDFFWDVPGNGNIRTFPGQGSGNVWTSGTAGVNSKGPTWTGPAKQLPFNPSPTFNGKAQFTAAKMAKTIINPQTAAVTLIGGMLIKRLLDDACLRVMGGQMQIAPGGQWEQCTTSPETITVYSSALPRNTNNTAVAQYYGWQASKELVAGLVAQDEAARQAAANSFCNPGFIFGSTQYKYGGSCQYTAEYTAGPTSNGSAVQLWHWLQSTGVNTKVAEYVYTSQQQEHEVRGWGQTSAESAEAKLTPKIQEMIDADVAARANAAEAQSVRTLNEIMNSGNSVEVGTTSPGYITPTLPGTPVTTTQTVPGPEGSTVKTDVTKTPQHTFTCTPGVTYGDVDVWCKHEEKETVKTVKTTTKADGTVVTDETITGTLPRDTANEDKAECLKSPNTLGCSEIDTPVGDPIPKSSVTVTYAEEELFGAGACPADSTLALGTTGKTVKVWDWQKTCAFALPLRAMIISLAAFAAFLIVMPGQTRV